MLSGVQRWAKNSTAGRWEFNGNYHPRRRRRRPASPPPGRRILPKTLQPPKRVSIMDSTDSSAAGNTAQKPTSEIHPPKSPTLLPAIPPAINFVGLPISIDHRW